MAKLKGNVAENKGGGRKRNRIFTRYSPDDLRNAIDDVMKNGFKIAPTARAYNIPVMTLYDTIKRVKNNKFSM